MGRGYLGHYGNYSFQELVDTFAVEYDSANKRAQKTKIAQTIVKQIQARGGRFLQKRGSENDDDDDNDDGNHSSSNNNKKTKHGGWVVVKDTVAVEKVKNRFRQIRRNWVATGTAGSDEAPVTKKDKGVAVIKKRSSSTSPANQDVGPVMMKKRRIEVGSVGGSGGSSSLFPNIGQNERNRMFSPLSASEQPQYQQQEAPPSISPTNAETIPVTPIAV